MHSSRIQYVIIEHPWLHCYAYSVEQLPEELTLLLAPAALGAGGGMASRSASAAMPKSIYSTLLSLSAAQPCFKGPSSEKHTSISKLGH
jgi:hypothetical protein